MTRLFAAFAFALLSLLVLPASGSASKIITEQFNKPMPEVKLAPEADFMAETKEVSEKPGDDADFEYAIRVPKSWTRAESGSFERFTVADKVLREFAKFYSPAPAGVTDGIAEMTRTSDARNAPLSDRSYLLMRAAGLGYTMTAHEWFMQYLLANKFNLQGMAKHGDNMAEALYVVLSDSNESYVVRGMARINGGKLVFAEYYVPIEKWEAGKTMQAQVLHSLAMKNPRKGDVEPLSSYEFLDIEEIRYPSSWTLRTAPLRSVDRMEAQLFNIGKTVTAGKETETLQGRIEVDMIAAHTVSSLDTETENQRRDLEDQGLNLGEIIEQPEDFILNPVFDFAETTVYESSDNKGKFIGYEFWMTVVSVDDYYFVITLLTPSREVDYFLWAKNKHHYKIVINSIRQNGKKTSASGAN